METLRIGKHKIVAYTAINELPIVRYHRYQKLMLVDAGIGADILSLDRRLDKTRRYLLSGKSKEAAQELENLRQCVYLIQSGLNPRHRAFAALVTEVDGVQFPEASDEAADKIAEMLNDVPIGELSDIVDAVKKKIEAELRLYFPRLFESPETKEYYDLLRQRTFTLLKAVAAGEDAPEENAEVQRLTDALATFDTPQNYAGPEGVEVRTDKNFEDVCLVLAEQLHINPKTSTVFEYYNAYDFVQRRAKEAENAQKRTNFKR